MSNRAIALLIAAAVAILVLTQTLYTVDPTKQVLVRQFGALVGPAKTEPGLYAKIPFIQDVMHIDRRLLDYEAAEFEIIAGDQKRLVVDAFARFRIVDPRRYVERVPTGEAQLRGILDSLINSEIRGVLSSVPLHAVLTEQRASLMDDITKRVNAKSMELGVQIVDVRIKRADLPQANSQSVYNRMKTDREREAAQLRAEGDEEKQRITSTADREVAVIKADAGYKGQVTMAEADGEATKIYADAFNKDKDFYAFWRRLEAYRQAFSTGGTVVLSPDSDFFRYFEEPPGAAASGKK
jgi:membrane protease subunit HflC